MIEETVGIDKETVNFNVAVKHVKESRRMFYKDISERIGLTKEQGEQIRAGKRRASNEEIKALIKHFPESAKFFSNDTLLFEDEINTNVNQQTLNEPMGTHFYGKHTISHRDELVETQRKLIAKLEEELEEVKRKLNIVEGEKKALVEIVSQRK